MGLGWRRAFCTSIPKDKQKNSLTINTNYESDPSPIPSPKLSSRIVGLFSNPSTPRLNKEQLKCTTVIMPSQSAPQSPRLQCKTKSSPRFFNKSTPSSPRISKGRCGLCSQNVKAGQGTAIFTAECGHIFHFPCIASHVKKQSSLTCPTCSSTWKEMHLMNVVDDNKMIDKRRALVTNPKLKIYNDDEPLSSPACGARFNTILESDESLDEDFEEFPGFFVVHEKKRMGNLEVGLLSEPVVVSVGKTTDTYAVVLRIRVPNAPLNRTPVDLVTVLNVSRIITEEKMHLMKKTMRMVVSLLSATDRLSIVAYSSTSKRLLPLRRMNSSGKRVACRIIDAIVALNSVAVSSADDSLKKAAKIMEDRRETNPSSSIMLFSDGQLTSPIVSSTRFVNADIPIHTFSLSACFKNALGKEALGKCVTSLLRVVYQDVRFHLGFNLNSNPAKISAVYSCTNRPAYLGSGSKWCRVGDFYSDEEKELLVELKVPSSFGGSQRVLSVRCSYKDPSTQQRVNEKERPLLVPSPRAIGSSTREIQRVKYLFVTTRAIAESRRLRERGDVEGAHHMLVSARALVLQSGTGLVEEFVRGLEAELAEVNWRRRDSMQEVQVRCRNNHQRDIATWREEEKVDPLTPTSAWRAAERLAKVAIMRKTLNRVSDLHGFENAGF